MIYRAEIFTEADVDPDHIEAAAGSIVRLADSMGIHTFPDINLTTVPDDVWTLNSRGQVDRTILDVTPVSDSLKLFVTARDLGTGDGEIKQLNYLFGASRLGRVIMSTVRVRTSEEFGSLVLHEAGHAEGLVQPTKINYDRWSSFAGHCINPCLMRPGNSYEDMQDMATRYRSNNPFCVECTGFLEGRPRFSQ